MKMVTKAKNKTHKETYTEWWLKYPWHVSDEPYPKDENRNCACTCEYCQKRYEHKATRYAHIH